VILQFLLAVALGAPARDTYPRQPLDAEHYRFALTLSDSVDRIEGEAKVRLRMLTSGATSVFLDLANVTPARAGKGMAVSQVTLGTTVLRHTHSDDRLTMTLPAPSVAGQVLELTVRYAGIPADGLKIAPTRHGDRAFFSDDGDDRDGAGALPGDLERSPHRGK
jgi:aminopeptidase N